MDFLKYPSLVVLVIANLIPLYGAYALGWSAAELMLLYWTESAIVGFFNIFKMALSKGLAPNTSPHPQSILSKALPPDYSSFVMIFVKLFFILFFIIHYGGFMFGHLMFIILIFVKDFTPDLFLSILVGSFSLFISHGISFVFNFIWKKEYEKANITMLMMSPYQRIILMHFAILLGFVINAPLVILIVGKTIADSFSHLKERESYS